MEQQTQNKIDLSIYNKNIFLCNQSYKFEILAAVHMILYNKTCLIYKTISVYNAPVKSDGNYINIKINSDIYSINKYNLSLEPFTGSNYLIKESAITIINAFYDTVDYLYNKFEKENIDFTNLTIKYNHEEDKELEEYFNSLDGMIEIYKYNS